MEFENKDKISNGYKLISDSYIFARLASWINHTLIKDLPHG